MADTKKPCATRSCRHWHNESTLNCNYPHQIDECVSFTPTLVNVEKELLCMLADRQPWWPYEEAADRAYVHKLYELYGKEINLVNKFHLWEDYWFDKPARERTNPRLGFHNWCIHGVRLGKRYEAQGQTYRRPATAAPAPRDASTPSGRPAGNADSAPGTNNAPDRVKRILAEAAEKAGEVFMGGAGTLARERTGVSVPPTTLLTPEELESRRRKNLEWAKSQGGKKQ